MFCKNCGAQQESNARFCPHCGSAQAVTPPVQPVTPPTEPVSFADKVRATAKKVGSSPMFLIATICFTLVQVLGLLSLFSTGSILNDYADIFEEFQLNTQEILSVFENTILVSGIVGMIPTIVITVGLWITYGTCASRKNRINTSGLTMIFVVNLVQLVLSCFILLLALLFTIIAIPGINYYAIPETEFLKSVLVVLLITLLVVFAFVLVYYIKLCTTATNVRNTMKTGVPNKRASRFVGVMCYISGGVLILSGIGDLLSAGIATLDVFYDASLFYVLPSDLFLSGISSLLTAAAQILFGILIFSYRSKMEALETEARMTTFKTLSYAEPYTAPVYIPPQPVAESVPEPEVTPEPAVVAEPANEEEIN